MLMANALYPKAILISSYFENKYAYLVYRY